MDMGVDDAYAHKLAWERKWHGVVVLSPRNILTNLFGAKNWNNQFSALHSPPEKQPNLSQSFPLTTSQLDRLTPTGVEHIEIVNDIYKKVQGIKKVEKYREERNGVSFGVINHPRLFRYEVYEYTFASAVADVGKKLNPKKYTIYQRKNWVSDMPHEKHREEQAELFNRYTDKQGRQKQY